LQIIADFMEVAEHCRASKIKSPPAAPPPAAEEPAAPPAAAAADCSPSSLKLKTLGTTKLPKSIGQRMAILRAVHQAMDDDETGYIEAPELMLLGQARRKFGHKSGDWTEVMNLNLMDRLDKTGDGKVESKEFAEYFDRVLPVEPEEFMKNVDQFMAVANHCKSSSDTVEVSGAEAENAAEQPSEVPKQPAAEEPADWRIVKLLEVFAVFDLDNSGTIDLAELSALGKMRQELGQKK